jgi:lysophospholipase L1-like esterase
MRYLFYFLLLSLFTCSTPISKHHLLVIGDSNGANKGWVYHLQELRGGGPLVNTSIGGNTFGFDGMGELRRNTLENLTAYLRKGFAEMGQIDEILISLGTNDCKAEYGDQREEVYKHLATVLKRTRAFFEDRGQKVPRIILITPPVAGQDDMVSDEFQGVAKCLEELSVRIRATAESEGLCLVDFQETPGAEVLKYSKDGIHFSAEGYKLLSAAVLEACF